MAPLLAVVAWSGTGKTTLLRQLIPLLKAKGIRPGLIKHTHHDMDVDKPGKDSYILRKAGADQTETPSAEEFNLAWLASRMDMTRLDIVLVEGFKGEAVPKIVLWRKGLARPLEELLDPNVIAIVCDEPLANDLPILDINYPDTIANFITDWLKQQRFQ